MNSNRVVADLHTHTTASDGVHTLKEVISIAQDRGLDSLAITDHDRVHPSLTAPIEYHVDIAVIRGIEIKVERSSGNHLDLLAFGVRSTNRLASLVRRLQEDRVERGARIQQRVEARLDVELDLTAQTGIGRPHIARAIERHSGIDLDVQGAFDELIGDGKPCFVRRAIPTYEEAASVLSDAASIVAVAHPLRYENVEEALSVAVEVGAVERWYPYEESVDFEPLDAAIERDNLLAIGGSDAHGDEIGECGLDTTSFEPVREALGITP